MKYINIKSKKIARFFMPVLIFLICFSVLLLSNPLTQVYGENENEIESESGIESETLIVSEKTGGDFLTSNPNLRIGLVFGKGTGESFQTNSENGYYFGYVKNNASDEFNIIFFIKNTKITVARLANLAKNSAGKYYASSNNIVVGKYSIEFDATFDNFAEAYNFIGTLPKGAFKNLFSAYIGGRIVMRFGDFASVESAKAKIAALSDSSPVALKVTEGSNKTAVVINSDTNEVIFEYEDGDNNFAVAGAPAVNPDLIYGQSISELSYKNTSFITSPAGNIYPGAFIYRINNSGVEVLNLMSLDEYVKCVVSSEISPYWHEEALKAFSVAVRTFAVHAINRHVDNGFMLCNETHCQLLIGMKRATAKSNAAVDATKDLVATYNNQTIETTYCSSSGGVTENHNDAWGGALKYPYLVSVKLPFENYSDPNRLNAMWTKSASPRELYEYLVGASPYALKFKGKLNSEISRIVINERSPSSNYIKSVTVTDKNGNSVTIKNSATIRGAFTKYANSANMDIFKSFKFKSYIMPSTGKTVNQDIEAGKTYIMTANGLTRSTPGDGTLSVLTATGKYSIKAYATGNDFIFDGKGWGHGAGLSQWAMQDMAELGYDYATILKTFYTGIEIKKMTDIKG